MPLNELLVLWPISKPFTLAMQQVAAVADTHCEHKFALAVYHRASSLGPGLYSGCKHAYLLPLRVHSTPAAFTMQQGLSNEKQTDWGWSERARGVWDLGTLASIWNLCVQKSLSHLVHRMYSKLVGPRLQGRHLHSIHSVERRKPTDG